MLAIQNQNLCDARNNSVMQKCQKQNQEGQPC